MRLWWRWRVPAVKRRDLLPQDPAYLFNRVRLSLSRVARVDDLLRADPIQMRAVVPHHRGFSSENAEPEVEDKPNWPLYGICAATAADGAPSRPKASRTPSLERRALVAYRWTALRIRETCQSRGRGFKSRRARQSSRANARGWRSSPPTPCASLCTTCVRWRRAPRRRYDEHSSRPPRTATVLGIAPDPLAVLRGRRDRALVLMGVPGLRGSIPRDFAR